MNKKLAVVFCAVTVLSAALISIARTDQTRADETPVALHLYPLDQKAKEGETVTWYLTAAGGEPLQYQWKLNGKEVTGARARTLRLASVKVSDGGSYTCLIKNQYGSTESDPVSLSVRKDTTAFSSEKMKQAQILSSQLR